MSIRRGVPVTYLRFAFAGELIAQFDEPLDTGIIRAMWMSYDELVATQQQHRSELILRCIDDYLAGSRIPLSAIYTDSSVKGEVK